MITEILRNSKIIREASEIKKDSFKYFFIDDIKNLETITDVEDLGDLKNVEILLTTDKNYTVGKPSPGDWYKINSEDLIKYMEKTVDKFESGDYLDFISSYSLTDLIVNYLESTFQLKCYRDWTDFVGTMEGAGKIEGLQENSSPIDGWDVYKDVYDSYVHGGKRGLMIAGKKEYDYYKKLSHIDDFITVSYNSRMGQGSVTFTDKGIKQFNLKSR